MGIEWCTLNFLYSCLCRSPEDLISGYRQCQPYQLWSTHTMLNYRMIPILLNCQAIKGYFFFPPALTAAMKDAGMRWKAPRVLKLDQWLSSFYGRFFFLELSITNANDAKWQEKCTYSERIKLCFHSPRNNYNCALYYTGCIHASSLNVTIRTSWIRGHKISTNTTSV